MLTQNDIRILSKIFSDYSCVMTTAQLTNEKLFYRDIQRMLEQGLIERIKRAVTIGWKTIGRVKWLLSTACSLMQFFVWKQPFSIIDTVTGIPLNGILLLTKILPESVQILIILSLRLIGLSQSCFPLEKQKGTLAIAGYCGFWDIYLWRYTGGMNKNNFRLCIDICACYNGFNTREEYYENTGNCLLTKP